VTSESTPDWVDWHREYDNPSSSLSRRLVVVQEAIRGVMTHLTAQPARPVGVVGTCSGDARDITPVLAEQSEHRSLRVLLTERHPVLANRARARVRAQGIDQVEVRKCDSGLVDSYLEYLPADLLVMTGVLGNVTDDDAERTISTLPSLLSPGGFVVWTRGRGEETDPSLRVRQLFSDRGFEEISFVAPQDEVFRVGVNKRDSSDVQPAVSGTRMFSFVDG
jgi:protein-L-isoaspartate O-methyltransferase